MTSPALNQLDRDVIESVLQMGSGYVLDFSDRTFTEFFRDFDVQIDDPEYRADGASKAKRLRVFLQIAPPRIVGKVLGALLERRLLKLPNALNDGEVVRFRAIVQRFAGTVDSTLGSNRAEADPESELMKRVFQPELLTRLRLDTALAAALSARMTEALACIESKAYLGAVILAGSVLEGLCLGYGRRAPARVNRALRDFRNYVHPAEQLDHRFTPDQHTARIGLQVVVAAIEDLARASANPDGTDFAVGDLE
jgi:hypothetical protein